MSEASPLQRRVRRHEFAYQVQHGQVAAGGPMEGNGYRLGSYRIATAPEPNSFFGESAPSTVNSIVRGMNYGSALTLEMTGGQYAGKARR